MNRPPSIEDACHRRYAGDLRQRLDHEIAGDTEAVFRAGAHVSQRREIVADPHCCTAPGANIMQRRADELTFDRRRTFRRPGHAAEGNARRGDPATVETDPERTEHGGDILVEPLADLEGPEESGGRKFWDDQAPHEFASLAILFAVADEELLERQRAYPLALAQLDAAADRACRAHLNRAEPPQDFRDIRIDRRKW